MWCAEGCSQQLHPNYNVQPAAGSSANSLACRCRLLVLANGVNNGEDKADRDQGTIYACCVGFRLATEAPTWCPPRAADGDTFSQESACDKVAEERAIPSRAAHP
jgi:hypothetical protein